MAEILSLIAVVFMLIVFKVLDRKQDDDPIMTWRMRRGK